VVQSSSGEKHTATAVPVANEVTGKVEESPTRVMDRAAKNTFDVIHGIALTHDESLLDATNSIRMRPVWRLIFTRCHSIDRIRHPPQGLFCQAICAKR
jgi:hypothetical protein